MFKKLQLFIPLPLFLLLIYCSQFDHFQVHFQVTGPGETNTYLLVDTRTKEAAIFDVGGPIDKLESIITEQNLDLKYIFVTHSHCDHVYGIPAVRKKFPQAKIGISREDYEDIKHYAQWEQLLKPEMVAQIKKSPEMLKMVNFNFELIGKPDVFLKDDQTLKLGDLEIRTFLTPGHSRGSICFYIGNVLFAGDVLFHRKVGRTDLPFSGGPDAIVKSVRRLYSLLPDETIVYPGHGKFTDIGTEKKENEEVSMDKVDLQN